MKIGADKATTCEIAGVEVTAAQIARIERAVPKIHILETASLRYQSDKLNIRVFRPCDISDELLVLQLNLTAISQHRFLFLDEHCRERKSLGAGSACTWFA